MGIVEDNKVKIKEALSKFEGIGYVFLFGSSLDKMRPESDVDILLGGDLTHADRTDLAMELELIFKRKVDVVLAREAPCELVLEALSKGTQLLAKDKAGLRNDYFKNFYLYDDARNLRELRRLRVKKRHAHG